MKRFLSKWHSVRPNFLDTLRENGVNTVAEFMCCDIERLAQRVSVSTEDLSSLQATITTQTAAFTMNGSDLYEEMMSRFHILSTGFDNLDELLDGGLYTGELTEIVGAAGVGKSQICMSIALFTAMETKKNVLYIDTGGSFSATRVKDMLEQRHNSLSSQDLNNILSRISVIQAFDVFSVIEALERVRDRICKQDDDNDDNMHYLQMIIVDCIAGVISPILGGQQIQGHSLMVSLARILKSLAVAHSVTVVITNNLVSDSSKSSFCTKPALGPTWAHIPNTRILIQKNLMSEANSIVKEKIMATLIKSSKQVDNSCIFLITKCFLYSPSSNST